MPAPDHATPSDLAAVPTAAMTPSLRLVRRWGCVWLHVPLLSKKRGHVSRMLGNKFEKLIRSLQPQIQTHAVKRGMRRCRNGRIESCFSFGHISTSDTQYTANVAYELPVTYDAVDAYALYKWYNRSIGARI